MSPTSDQPLLLLVDGHSLAFRSFYAFSKGGEGGLGHQRRNSYERHLWIPQGPAR